MGEDDACFSAFYNLMEIYQRYLDYGDLSRVWFGLGFAKHPNKNLISKI